VKTLLKVLSCKDGATAVEYAIIAGMIGLAIIAAAASVGTELTGVFADVKNGLGGS
jgi:pilus assembly protein Flp/PilA